MTKHEFHNAARKLLNIEWAQLTFLTDSQKDNFFANPHKFFIRADDETADKLWELMFPKPPQAREGVVVDLEKYRKVMQERPLIPHAYRWTPEVRVGGVPVVQNGAADTFPPLIFANAG